MCPFCLKYPASIWPCTLVSTEEISTSGGEGEMGEQGGWRFIALCIILIESLSFLLALHCLYCSTSMSPWLLHMPTNRLMSFLIGEEGFCLLLCYLRWDRSDRSGEPVRPVPIWTLASCYEGCWSASPSSVSISSSFSEYLWGDGMTPFLGTEGRRCSWRAHVPYLVFVTFSIKIIKYGA